MLRKVLTCLAVALMAIGTLASIAAAAPTAWVLPQTVVEGMNPAVTYFGGQYEMWYVASGTLVHCTSSDLPGQWSDPTQVFLDATPWNTAAGGNGSEPYVMKTAAETYYMWCPSGDRTTINLYKSTDGDNWTFSRVSYRRSSSTGWDAQLSNPMVLADGTALKLYYQGTYNGVSSIGLATSSSGVDYEFSQSGGNPIISAAKMAPGSAIWGGATNFYQPWVVKEDATHYTMWFGANSTAYGTGSDAIAVATSPDGKNWTYTANQNPVIGSTDGNEESQPTVLNMDGEWRTWYQQNGSELVFTYPEPTFAPQSTDVGFCVTANVPIPGGVDITVLGFSLGTIPSFTLKQNASTSKELIVTNTGNVAEEFTFTVSKMAGFSNVSVTAPGTVAVGNSGTAVVNITAGSVIGAEKYTITVTASAK